jgi:small subunit ribosomal protein S25e
MHYADIFEKSITLKSLILCSSFNVTCDCTSRGRMRFSLCLNSAHTNRLFKISFSSLQTHRQIKPTIWRQLLERKARQRRSGAKAKARLRSCSWLCLSEPNKSCRTVKDKAQHAVILDKATSDKLNKDVQSYRLITVAVLVDRLKINGSVARRALADLEERGQIKKVVGHSKLNIYSTLCLIPSAAKTISWAYPRKC